MNEPKDDMLNGVADYAKFTGWSERRCSYLLEKGLLPGGKVGRLWVGSKSITREHLAKIAKGVAA